MDFYGYYMERFSWGSNPYSAIEKCQRVVAELLDNPTVPFRIAIGSATGFLAALADYAGNGCMVSKSYGDVLLALNESLYIQQTVVEAIDQEWNQEEKDVEIHPDDIPLGDPGYVVEPVDLEGADPDDGKGDWSPDVFCHAAREPYSSEGEPCATDVRNLFPDWEHIDKRIQADWEKLQIYKNKVLAPIGHSFDYMRPATDTLAAIEFHIHRLPLSRRAELFVLAAEIVDALMDGLENNLQSLCTGLIHSHRE